MGISAIHPLLRCTSSWDCCFEQNPYNRSQKKEQCPFHTRDSLGSEGSPPLSMVTGSQIAALMSSLGSLCLQNSGLLGTQSGTYTGQGQPRLQAESSVLRDPVWDHKFLLELINLTCLQVGILQGQSSCCKSSASCS